MEPRRPATPGCAPAARSTRRTRSRTFGGKIGCGEGEMRRDLDGGGMSGDGAVAVDLPSAARTQTRGIRVDGRVRSVDVLENLISLGQQEAILRATLRAAQLKPGDRMLDVGCGSGKLALAAARFLASGPPDS